MLHRKSHYFCVREEKPRKGKFRRGANLMGSGINHLSIHPRAVSPHALETRKGTPWWLGKCKLYSREMNGYTKTQSIFWDHREHRD